jgi:hypothetical protein
MTDKPQMPRHGKRALRPVGADSSGTQILILLDQMHPARGNPVFGQA